jgi:hydroxysqualene synthase
MLSNTADILALTTPDGGGGRFCAASDAEAYNFCKRLARSHYENFPVGSLLIPRVLQPHFFSVYAFARLADDVADELTGSVEKFAALERLEMMLTHKDYPSTNPIARALQATMRTKSIPALPFQKLLSAFRTDAAFEAPQTMHDLEQYSEFSAHPVGELVLRIFSLYTPERIPFSDAICTALQLANFWQDFSVDIPRGRLMIPQTILHQHSLHADELFALHDTSADDSRSGRDALLKNVAPRFLLCLDVLFHETKLYFTRGKELLPSIPHDYYRLRLELALTIAGGERILEKVFSLKEQVLICRPRLDSGDFLPLLRAFVRLLVR